MVGYRCGVFFSLVSTTKGVGGNLYSFFKSFLFHVNVPLLLFCLKHSSTFDIMVIFILPLPFLVEAIINCVMLMGIEWYNDTF